MSHRIDFHLHTVGSPDGGLHERDFKRAFETERLHTVVITDHDSIDEALRLQSVFPENVIVGEEITTADGEIIGLYLSRLVKKGMSAKETVKEIRDQNGLVYIPHPFERARKGLSWDILDGIVDDVDIIEVINGRSFSSKARNSAVAWARINNVAQAASSDAHGRIGWGNVYTELPEKPTRDTLVNLTQTATTHGNINGLLSYGYPKLNRYRKRNAS